MKRRIHHDPDHYVRRAEMMRALAPTEASDMGKALNYDRMQRADRARDAAAPEYYQLNRRDSTGDPWAAPRLVSQDGKPVELLCGSAIRLSPGQVLDVGGVLVTVTGFGGRRSGLHRWTVVAA